MTEERTSGWDWQSEPNLNVAAPEGVAGNPAYTADERVAAANRAAELRREQLRRDTRSANDPDLGLLSTDLRAIAQALEGLEKAGVVVDTIRVSGRAVHVKFHDDQRDGPWYTVTRISAW